MGSMFFVQSDDTESLSLVVSGVGEPPSHRCTSRCEVKLSKLVVVVAINDHNSKTQTVMNG